MRNRCSAQRLYQAQWTRHALFAEGQQTALLIRRHWVQQISLACGRPNQDLVRMNPFDSCNALVWAIQRDAVECLCESVAAMHKQHGFASIVHCQYLGYLLIVVVLQRYIKQEVDAVRFV